MPTVQGGQPFDDIARRWHALAERRLAHYEELYRSGRWRRYYRSEEQFARHMLDVLQATKNWAALAGRLSQARPLTATPLPEEPALILSPADRLRPAA